MMDQFLQSPDWQAVVIAQGYGVIVGDGFWAVCKKMKFGFKQLYVGRAQLTEEQLQQLERIAHEQRVDFIRIDPLSHACTLVGYHRVSDVQPSVTRILDLSISEDELLAAMHPKTRYNIRLAERKGVLVRTAGLEAFDDFWRLIAQTYERKGIAAHDQEHYRAILKHYSQSYLALAEYEGRVIVANMMVRYGNTVTYLHGGSDVMYRHLMAPHFLQWSEIQRSRREGFAFYDFWGIAPDESPDHRWAGVTRFKQGFGGQVVRFPGTFEKGVSWRYTVYQILSQLRRS